MGNDSLYSWSDDLDPVASLQLAVQVLIVAVILVVVVIAFVRVVIVVMFIRIVVVVGGVSSIFKLSFVIIGVLHRIVFYYLLHQPLSYGVPVGLVFLLGLLALAIVAACASRAAAMPSAISCWMAAKVMAGVSDDSTKILEFKTSRDRYGDNGMSYPIGGLVFKDSSRTGSFPSGRVDLTGDEDPTDEDGDTRVSDSEVSVSLGEISSGGKKSQESNIGDTEDGGKAVGEKTSVAKRYLVKSSEELGEMFPGMAGK
ncbi:hypothetical protein Tco_1024058 [Tanacetum coccineum]